jgi:hypothetical protein
MTASRFARTLCAAALACLAFTQDLRAQSAQPSAAAVAIAREIVELKGGITIFDGVVSGVIEFHKKALLTANPNLSKDLEEISNRLIKENAPRRAEVQTEIARAYASRFTEAELKDILAFYKTPLGKKLIVEEPAGLDEATKRVDAWASKYAEEMLAKMRAEMRKKGHTVL